MAKRTRRATMNISVPGSLKAWIDREVQRGDYGTASEFIRATLRHVKALQDEFEESLVRALNEPTVPMTDEDWRSIRRRARNDSRQDRARRDALIDEIDRTLIAAEASGPAREMRTKDWDALMRRAKARADSVRRDRATRRKSA